MTPLQIARNNRKTVLLIMGALSLAVMLAYYPVLGNGFINFDDTSYVTANTHVREGLTPDSIRWAFTTLYFYNWHPVTWLSHMLDVELFGLNPVGHHAVSLLLHLANSLLLFSLFRMMTGATVKSLFLAALFALHPLHVEAVAWISGRKDLLSTLFGLLTLLAYVRYSRALKPLPYALSVLMFTISLMAKSMFVTMPFLLLLLDFWPLRRGGSKPLSRLLAEKVPFVVLAIASSLITYYAQQQARALATGGSFTANLGLAAVNYGRYILKMFWPLKLAVYYPYSPAPYWQTVLAFFVIAAVTAGALRYVRRLPWLTFGWFWYLFTLMPVAGFVRIGQHSIADRYSYIPLIGLFVAIVWGGEALAERLRISLRGATAAMAVVILTCAVLSNLQAARWRDSVTVFSHTLAVTQNNALAHKNLGAALAERGELAAALDHVTESLRLQPEPLEYVSQAWLRLQLGDYVHAVESAKSSLSMMPDNNDKAHFILGAAYVSLQDTHDALAEYETLRGTGSPYAYRLYDILSASGLAPQVSPP